MTLDETDKLVITMRENGSKINEIILALYPDFRGEDKIRNLVKHRVERLREKGLIETRKRGNPTLRNVKKQKCGYPRCRVEAEKEFAFVPLCNVHHSLIVDETAYFYEGGEQSEYKRRKHYLKIVDQIKHRYKGDEVNAKETRTISKPKKVIT